MIQKIDAHAAAEHYADSVAPLPSWDSLSGTVLAVFASTVVSAIFTMVAGVYFDVSVQWPSLITISVVGAGTYWVLRNAELRHQRARDWMEQFLRADQATE